MFACQSFEELSHGATFTALRLFQASADGAHTLEKLLVFNEPLVGIGALNNYFRLAVDGQHGGRPGLLQLGDMVAGVALEIAQGVDVREVNDHTANLHEMSWCRNIALHAQNGYATLYHEGRYDTCFELAGQSGTFAAGCCKIGAYSERIRSAFRRQTDRDSDLMPITIPS